MLPTIIAALSLIGVGLLLSPAVAAYVSQYAQSQRIDDYSAGMRDLGGGLLAADTYVRLSGRPPRAARVTASGASGAIG